MKEQIAFIVDLELDETVPLPRGKMDSILVSMEDVVIDHWRDAELDGADWEMIYAGNIIRFTVIFGFPKDLISEIYENDFNITLSALEDEILRRGFELDDSWWEFA